MIIEQLGAKYYHNGTDWIIGEKIVVIEGDYQGLNSILLSVRDGDDVETGNEGPDFYCSLQPLALPIDVTSFEQRMRGLYGEQKAAENIPLDLIILSPDELEPVKKERPKLKVYVVTEDWAASDDSDTDNFFFTDYRLAKACLNDRLYCEKHGGCISEWVDAPNFYEESEETFYECYVDGWYQEKHYVICITSMELELSEEAFKTIGEAYINSPVSSPISLSDRRRIE